MDTNVTNPTHTTAVPKERLMEDLRQVVSDADELLRATASLTSEGAASARARIQDSMKSAKARLATAQSDMIERTREAAKATDEYAHKEPWTLVGVSAIAGAVIGMLIARR